VNGKGEENDRLVKELEELRTHTECREKELEEVSVKLTSASQESEQLKVQVRT